jgi:methionyl-tRNA synthetase
MTKGDALFPRIETRQEEAPKEDVVESLITFEEFQRMDIRVGTIIRVESIVNSKKLIKLTVDVGEERTVVAGIKGHYAEDALVGKQVAVLANLKPAKLMGIESQGMILAAGDAAGLHLIAPDAPTMPGTKIK